LVQDKLANCDLQLTLITKESISSAQVLQVCKDVKSIAASSNSLQAQGVSVRIRLRAVLGYELAVLISKELGPFLHSVDYHQVLDLAAELTKASGFFSNPASFFSSAAFKNLSASSSPLQSLCLSDHSLPQCEACQGIALENSISAIAELQHLTRLHLSIKARTDFEPLAQLSGLQDLALQSDSRSASACGVLTNNRQTLERVILTSRGWDTATLSALGTLPKLRTVTIKLLSLSVEDAVALSHLLQPDSIQIMLRKCSRMALEAFTILSSSQANITHLMLWEMENAYLCKLQSMQSLTGLTIVRPSSHFSGEALALQPNLDTLRLVSCFALTDDGLRSLLAAAPLVKMLLIQQELSMTCPAELNDSDALTKHGLVSVAQASNLVYLDLQGVKITRGGEKLLESTICAQQKAGKMQPAVAMVLPKFSKRYGDNVFTPECLHYPAFAPIPDGRRNIVICGNVNKNQELKDTIAAIQGMQLSCR
jgi:Leucine-rich repeat (LRR) protein